MFGHPNITTALWLFSVLGNLSWAQCPASASSISWKSCGSESWVASPTKALRDCCHCKKRFPHPGQQLGWESRGCLGDRLTQHRTRQECIWGWSLAGKAEKEKVCRNCGRKILIFIMLFSKWGWYFWGTCQGFQYLVFFSESQTELLNRHSGEV